MLRCDGGFVQVTMFECSAIQYNYVIFFVCLLCVSIRNYFAVRLSQLVELTALIMNSREPRRRTDRD